VIFGVSFFFFYKRAESKLPKQPLILTPAVINQPLPQADLVNLSGQQLADEKLRKGKVVLVFTLIECEPCNEENEFLKTVIGSRKDVTFIYVIPFGVRDNALKLAQNKYVVETFFDEHSMLSRSLQIYQVPIKIFLENGIIKKTWIDSSFDDTRKAEFKAWLGGV
jgi:hypothetical protein